MDSHIDVHMICCRVVITHRHPPIGTIMISLLLLLLLSTLPPSLSQPPPPRSIYSLCTQPYKCGSQPVHYPFWGQHQPQNCGGGEQFHLTCEWLDGYEHSSIQMGSQKFWVWNINITAYTVSMEPVRGGPDVCSTSPRFNFSLSPSFRYNQTVHNITIVYGCPSGVSPSGGYRFPCDDGDDVYYYEGTEDKVLKQHPDLEKCGRRIQVPAEAVHYQPNNVGDRGPDGTFGIGFNVSYTVSQECLRCHGSRGACGSNDTTHEFTCYCPDRSNNAHDCTDHVHVPVPAHVHVHVPARAPAASPETAGRRWNWRAKLGIGVGAAVFGALAVTMAFYIYQRRKKTRDVISYVQPRSMSSDPSLKDTEFGSIIYGVHLFTYTELEEATNYFDPARELGDGGFGTVYLGKLQDGRCVAVKRLYENNYRRVEQFKNEIKILTSLHHKNLVSLYGCSSRHSRELLLVYEYIPNGTVADHLHGERVKAGTLPWHIRMNIAVETASALAYLHASEVIHRDVKTNNILLDNHFVVKVADFGLSRLFPTHLTHVSTVPQGTPGYVDPEYHECYQLTVKSDVYSFGVVLVELISSLPAVDITRHRHEINLSNMAINKIHNQALHELVDPNLGFESDYKVRKMINAVAELAFQCLQSSKDMRPSMEEVLDTLRDIQSDGKYNSQPEVMDISTADDVVLLKDDPPPPSPDSNAVSKSTTPNASG